MIKKSYNYNITPLGGTQAYHEIFTGWKLGKGARDRHTFSSYRQHTDVALWFKWQTGQDRHLDTPAQGESQSSKLKVFSPPLM